jgi:anti-sigma-K factor RskA
MTSDTSPDRIDELIALAALGELSDAEQLELDVAVRNDPDVAADVAQAIETAAALQRPHAERPSDGLRGSVLAAISSTPQEHASIAAASAAADRVVSLESQRARGRLRPALLAAAAAVVLFAVGAVVLVATSDDPRDPIAAVIESPDAVSRTLAGEIDDLTVVYSASQQALVVEGDGVPVLDDTATYQLWLVGDDGPISVGTFRPDPDGRVSERFGGADPSGFVLGVTEEPAGGSESPTLPILASA